MGSKNPSSNQKSVAIAVPTPRWLPTNPGFQTSQVTPSGATKSPSATIPKSSSLFNIDNRNEKLWSSSVGDAKSASDSTGTVVAAVVVAMAVDDVEDLVVDVASDVVDGSDDELNEESADEHAEAAMASTTTRAQYR